MVVYTRFLTAERQHGREAKEPSGRVDINQLNSCSSVDCRPPPRVVVVVGGLIGEMFAKRAIVQKKV